MIMSRTECRPDLLSALLHGSLPDAQCRTLEGHIGICKHCQAKLDDLSGGKEWRTTTEEALRELDADELGLQKSPSKGIEKSPSMPSMEHGTWLQKVSENGMIGPYRLESVIGHGGTGVVALALDTQLQRRIAIKVLFPHLASNGAARQRFAREAQAAATVVHPSVVPIHAVDAQHDPPYLVMAYVPGGSLQQRLDRQGPLSVLESLRIALQVCEGLAAAHSQGIVHRDIKPANILLEAGTDRVLLSDFGLARALDDATLTASGFVAGTPPYMSPEQARGDQIDQRSDLFSVGSLLFAMLTGRPPFPGNSALSVLQNVCQKPTPSAKHFVETLPSWVDRLISLCHAKHPKDRIADANQLAEMMRQCLAHVQRPGLFPLPVGLRQRTWKPFGIGLGLLCTGIVLGMLPGWMNRFPQPTGIESQETSTPSVSAAEQAIPNLGEIIRESEQISVELRILESVVNQDW